MTTEEVDRRRKTIQEKNDLLVKYLEPDFGFLDKLQSKDVFLPEVIDEIRAEKTKRDRIQKMLEHLRYVEEIRYSCFLDALRQNQTHVVNFINGILDLYV